VSDRRDAHIQDLLGSSRCADKRLRGEMPFHPNGGSVTMHIVVEKVCLRMPKTGSKRDLCLWNMQFGII
jgi:hypothetical protein